MGKNKDSKKEAKKNNIPIICAAAAAAIAAGAVLFAGSAGGTVATAEINAGESLTIKTNDIGDSAKFYPVEVDGTKMEVLAIRDSRGYVRTAFNTCQSCYASGSGYYKAEGSELICQNCGFHFTAEQVGLEGGGCNPYPITEADRTETDSEITIPYEFLSSAKVLFGNWSKH